MSRRRFDAEAKDWLRDWPTQTKIWSATRRRLYWLRAQPPIRHENCRAPRLVPAGAKVLTTQPDGLWVTLGIERGDTAKAEFVDCLVIEASTGEQNLSDKRARYAARTGSLVVDFDKRWLDGLVRGPGKGGPLRARRELLGGELPDEDPVRLPVRYVRVLYALPDQADGSDLYEKAEGHIPLEAHEFVIARRKLRVANRDVRLQLARMSPYSQYLGSSVRSKPPSRNRGPELTVQAAA
jgi:hypothetical protein